MNKKNKERRLKTLLSAFETASMKSNFLDFWRTTSNNFLPSTLRYANNREISRDIDKLKSQGFLIDRKIMNFKLDGCSFQRVHYCFRGRRSIEKGIERRSRRGEYDELY